MTAKQLDSSKAPAYIAVAALLLVIAVLAISNKLALSVYCSVISFVIYCAAFVWREKTSLNYFFFCFGFLVGALSIQTTLFQMALWSLEPSTWSSAVISLGSIGVMLAPFVAIGVLARACRSAEPSSERLLRWARFWAEPGADRSRALAMLFLPATALIAALFVVVARHDWTTPGGAMLRWDRFETLILLIAATGLYYAGAFALLSHLSETFRSKRASAPAPSNHSPIAAPHT